MAENNTEKDTSSSSTEEKPVEKHVNNTATKQIAKPKRHLKQSKKSGMKLISNPPIRRLARRGGVKRISGSTYDEMRTSAEIFLSNTIKDAVSYTEYCHRRTVTSEDVVQSLKRTGKKLYGFY